MKRSIVYITSLLLILSSCIKEDHFGLSPYGNIQSIEISNQASQAVINSETYEISVEFPAGVDLSVLPIQTLTLSSFAVADKNDGDTLDLTQEALIYVTSENGTVTLWTVSPFVASATPQVVNSDFNDWYKTSGGYFEPGEDATSTVWGTGNPGTQILGLTATTPLEVATDDYATKMETLDNGALATAFGTPISAGSIFTGVFDKDNIDPSDPQAAITFGTPFTGRPEKFKFSYQYTPGIVNKDKDGNVLPDGDECDIYAFLEVRSGGTTQRLATAWFRSGDLQSTTSTQEIDFVYGALDNTYPSYMYPPNGNYVSSDSASFVLPSHITIVASSSFDGANFAGAIGSVLLLNDVEMVY